ncbi:MAG: helix-hairpin-helix domain-containing protein, partial [Rikenellaceae bacterium]
FDPNTVELRQLLEMGVDKSVALNLLRYRAAGKVFRLKEELIECRGFSDSLYFALEPYITIGEEYRYKPKPAPEQPKYSQPAVEPLSDSISKILESHAKYRVQKSRLEEESIDLNHADSATLISLPGIGAKSAEAIIRYRKLLGGYHSVTQLFEIPIITEENFSRFYKYLYTNIVDISKIDVNFASAAELSGHPYFSAARVRRLTKKRNTKGGWRNIEEMIEDNIFTSEEAQHVQPYLIFSTIEDPE